MGFVIVLVLLLILNAFIQSGIVTSLIIVGCAAAMIGFVYLISKKVENKNVSRGSDISAKSIAYLILALCVILFLVGILNFFAGFVSGEITEFSDMIQNRNVMLRGQAFCTKKDGKRTMRLQAKRVEIEKIKLMAAYYRPLNVHHAYEKCLFQKVLVLTREGLRIFSEYPIKFLLPNTEDKEFPLEFSNDHTEIFCADQRIPLRSIKEAEGCLEEKRRYSATWIEDASKSLK